MRTASRPGGKTVDTLGEALDHPWVNQVFHDQKTVTPKVGELAFGQDARLPLRSARSHGSRVYRNRAPDARTAGIVRFMDEPIRLGAA